MLVECLKQHMTTVPRSGWIEMKRQLYEDIINQQSDELIDIKDE